MVASLQSLIAHHETSLLSLFYKCVNNPKITIALNDPPAYQLDCANDFVECILIASCRQAMELSP